MPAGVPDSLLRRRRCGRSGATKDNFRPEERGRDKRRSASGEHLRDKKRVGGILRRPVFGLFFLLRENPVHFGAANRARALGRSAAVVHRLDLALKFPLLFALHTIAFKLLRHGTSPPVGLFFLLSVQSSGREQPAKRGTYPFIAAKRRRAPAGVKPIPLFPGLLRRLRFPESAPVKDAEGTVLLLTQCLQQHNATARVVAGSVGRIRI